MIHSSCPFFPPVGRVSLWSGNIASPEGAENQGFFSELAAQTIEDQAGCCGIRHSSSGTESCRKGGDPDAYPSIRSQRAVLAPFRQIPTLISVCKRFFRCA